MKATIKYIAGLLVAASTLTACNDNFELPPVIYPFDDLNVNATVQQVKAHYWSQERNYVNTVGTLQDMGLAGDATAADEHVIIKGRIVSDMTSGNIYNSIVIQDGEYALNIAVRTNRLTRTYAYGQEIMLDATGLKIGGYNGLMQIGAEGTYNNAPSMTFMESTDFEGHSALIGSPDPDKVEIPVVNMADIIAAKNSAEGLQKWQSRLVRFDNVTFDTPGQPLATDQNTNRTFRDAAGNTMIVRTSSYASFKATPVPAGTGSVVGILSYYGSDWQILLNGTDGLIGFTGAPDIPDTPGEAVTTLNQNFDASTDIPAGWTQKQVAGNKDWFVKTFNSNNYASMTGYQGTAPFDSWLMSPAVDIEKCQSKTLTFDTQVNGYGSKTTVFEVYVLDNADPDKATVKTKLSPTLATAPESGYSEWAQSGALDLSAFKGIVYIAFRYYATQDANYATWRVDNVKLNAQ